MKRFSLLLVIVFSIGFVMSSSAQSGKEEKKEERKIEKAAKKAAKYRLDSTNNVGLKKLVETQAFVLEANTLYTKTGQSFILNSTTDFVGFDGKNSTIQLAFDQLIAWNGVGGVTLDGSIAKMEIVDDKKGLGFAINVTVRQKVGGVVTMIFRVSTDGNARVEMSGNFGERLTYQGRIVSLTETRVYKGTPRF